jgi:hypothetical protein
MCDLDLHKSVKGFILFCKVIRYSGERHAKHVLQHRREDNLTYKGQRALIASGIELVTVLLYLIFSPPL